MRLSSTWLAAAAISLTSPFAEALPAPEARQSGNVCTEETAIVRKEYSVLTSDEKLAYINGLKCLMSKPSRLPAGEVPAAETYFDDYVAEHIKQSFSIHISGIFLSWHREYLHILETDLHNLCNYPAYLGIPYWDWLKYPILDNSPMFDGSETSLGGNGDPDPNPQPIQLAPNFYIPHGTGGGCVTQGPFANTEVRFGPFSPLLVTQGGGLPANWTQPNPHCLKRDFNTFISTSHMTIAFISLLQASLNIAEFQDRLTPTTLGTAGLGLHRAGHLSFGGDGSDFFSSPQEPAFFLHHSQVDRMWTQWQDAGALVVGEGNNARRYMYNGTSTTNSPVGVTPEVNNSTKITFGVLGEDITLGEAAYPTRGRYCYRYE